MARRKRKSHAGCCKIRRRQIHEPDRDFATGSNIRERAARLVEQVVRHAKNPEILASDSAIWNRIFVPNLGSKKSFGYVLYSIWSGLNYFIFHCVSFFLSETSRLFYFWNKGLFFWSIYLAIDDVKNDKLKEFCVLFYETYF